MKDWTHSTCSPSCSSPLMPSSMTLPAPFQPLFTHCGYLSRSHTSVPCRFRTSCHSCGPPLLSGETSQRFVDTHSSCHLYSCLNHLRAGHAVDTPLIILRKSVIEKLLISTPTLHAGAPSSSSPLHALSTSTHTVDTTNLGIDLTFLTPNLTNCALFKILRLRLPHNFP